jgi:uncharacterized membrane protein YcaP (DUF421 family)
MWHLSLPWWEFVLRGFIVYVFLILILRVTGKRQTGQLAPFDLVLLLVLSNAVQNAMNGGDNSVLGGLISATTLIGLHYVVAFVTFKSKRLEALIEGTPRMIIHNGVANEQVMRSEFLTHHELAAALRACGCNEISQVHLAMLENNGQITVSMRVRPAGS